MQENEKPKLSDYNWFYICLFAVFLAAICKLSFVFVDNIINRDSYIQITIENVCLIQSDESNCSGYYEWVFADKNKIEFIKECYDDSNLIDNFNYIRFENCLSFAGLSVDEFLRNK